MTLDLSHVAFFDGHLHPPLRTTPGDPGEFRWLWYEGRPDYSELVVDILPYRGAMRVLGQREQGETREIDLIARLAETDVLERLSQIVAAHNVVGLVLDTGYPPPEVSLSSAAIAAAAGCPVATLLRIEVAAEGLVEESNGFEDFVERFDATLAGARAEGYTGLKSVIAYRSGMAVEPSDGAAAREAFEAGLRSGARRLTAKPLLDFLLARALAAARRDALPFQFHAGYGDREIDLENANPLKLRPLLESGMADGVELVFLHGAWPYTREAAWLAAVYPTVYLDISTCIPPIGMHTSSACGTPRCRWHRYRESTPRAMQPGSRSRSRPRRCARAYRSRSRSPGWSTWVRSVPGRPSRSPIKSCGRLPRACTHRDEPAEVRTRRLT